MGKNALVITYHVKNCKRVGGFHYFIQYLEEFSYNIDWVTCSVSISWILHNNDRENLKNFIDLWTGINFEERGVEVHHFSAPIFIPAKMADFFNLKLGKHYWPKWERIRKRLKANYDVILVEGVGCQYAEDLRKDYPAAQIIYRPSDILQTFSSVSNADALEKTMIEIADKTICTDENHLMYYRKLVGKNNKLDILRNPLASEDDVQFLKDYTPAEHRHKTVVYIGASFVDLDMIEYAAAKNRMADFFVIGPFTCNSHDNIKYLGVLDKTQYIPYLESASVGISPLRTKNENVIYGYTRKIISYMRYLMPIVVTNTDNYLNVQGFFVAHSTEEFSKLVSHALSYTIEDRALLRNGYLKVMKMFLDDDCKLKLSAILEEGKNHYK